MHYAIRLAFDTSMNPASRRLSAAIVESIPISWGCYPASTLSPLAKSARVAAAPTVGVAKHDGRRAWLLHGCERRGRESIQLGVCDAAKWASEGRTEQR